jgi:hypothetical protein
MIRRTRWQYYSVDAASIGAQTAGWMGEVLGWDARKRTDELERYSVLPKE